MYLIKNGYSILKNIPGYLTSRKIVVVESDDWGSIRMPSKDVYNYLIIKGARIENDRYNRYETLECNDDLTKLYDVLTSFRDKNGKHPVITAVNVVANPDFEKIRQSGFNEYHYEPFTETLKRYPAHDQVYKLWKEGIEKRLFVPQFHGREHLNVRRWMRALQSGHKGEMEAFGLGLTGLHPAVYSPFKGEYQGAFEFDTQEDLEYLKDVISDGINLFENLCGYRPLVFVPTNGPLSKQLEPVLAENGIKFIQTARFLYKEPLLNGKVKHHIRYLGRKNKLGQRYFIRNCVFEPNAEPGFDWVGKCLKEMDSIFAWHKPVIITSHRVNYSGFLDPENRSTGLKMLHNLFAGMLSKWPDIEFITSAELGELMNNNFEK